MNKTIQNILNKKCSNKEKIKALDILNDEIQMARGILSGKYLYCAECNDYYLAKSYQTYTKTKNAKVCTYIDPINSGGNDYTDGFVDITYSICPKGHEHEIERKERV